MLPVVVGTVAFNLGKKVGTCTWHAWTVCELHGASLCYTPCAGVCLPAQQSTSLLQTFAALCASLLQATDYMTHRWTVYVRGPNNEDLSHIISKACPPCLFSWMH